MATRNCWIGVVSRDHVALAVAGGYAQLGHGKAGPLERMRAGDGLAYYSPREFVDGGAPVQAFTALGQVTSAALYQAEGSDGSRPFRLAVEYVPATPAPIRPLLPSLTFIRSKTHWGAAFRFGIVRVPEEDFARIAAAMRCSVERPAGTAAGPFASG
jgi:hypothetical protein